MKYQYIFFCFLASMAFVACNVKTKHIDLKIDLPLAGTSTIELIDITTGSPLAKETCTDGKLEMRLDSVYPTIYLVDITWNRAYVSPNETRLMHKHQAQGDTVMPSYRLQHYVYLSPKEQDYYLFTLNNSNDQAAIEQAYHDKDINTRLILKNPTGKNVLLQEEMENLYASVRKNYFTQKDSLNQILYRYIESSDSRTGALNQKITSLWEAEMLPILTQRQNEFIAQHPDSPISAYILFNRVLNIADFEANKKLYDLLSPEAKKNPMGHMLVQYDKKLMQE